MSDGAGRYYDRLADLWDELYAVTVPYDEGFKFIDRLRRTHRLEKAILDVGCGTGELLRRFEDAGYETYGADRSREMVRRAREKCSQSSVKRATFQDVSFRREVPIISSFFNSLAYCQTPTELTKTLEHLRGQLQGGGLVVFDLVTVDDPKKNTVVFDVKKFELAAAHVSRTFFGRSRRRRFTSDMTYVIHWKNDEKQVISERTTRGCFSTEDVVRCIQRAGLAPLEVSKGYMGDIPTFVGQAPL